MKLARLFLAVVTIGTLAACNNSATAPDTKATDAPARKSTTCSGTIETDSAGVSRCYPTIGSGG